MKTTIQKFTVMLFPDEDGYTVIVPHYARGNDVGDRRRRRRSRWLRNVWS